MESSISGSNFFNDTITDVYEALQKTPIYWPGEMSYTHRIALVERMIQYFEETGQFEKCQYLKKVLEVLHTEPKK